MRGAVRGPVGAQDGSCFGGLLLQLINCTGEGKMKGKGRGKGGVILFFSIDANVLVFDKALYMYFFLHCSH